MSRAAYLQEGHTGAHMHSANLGDRERIVTDHFTYENLDATPQGLNESYRLRYQVYCLERAFLPSADYPQGIERDEFDANSAHFGAYNNEGAMVGAARLVLSDKFHYPLFEHCQLDSRQTPNDMNGTNTAEVSRLVLSKLYRRRPNDGLYGTSYPETEAGILATVSGGERRRQPEIVLGLYQIMYRFSVRHGMRYCLAAMERPLARLLGRYCFDWRQAGPQVDYYGPVAPYVLDLLEFTEALKNGNPGSYAGFTKELELPPTWLGQK